MRPPTPLHFRAAQAREDKVVQSNTEMALAGTSNAERAFRRSLTRRHLPQRSFESSDTNAFTLHYPLSNPGAIVIHRRPTGPETGGRRYPPLHIS